MGQGRHALKSISDPVYPRVDDSSLQVNSLPRSSSLDILQFCRHKDINKKYDI